MIRSLPKARGRGAVLGSIMVVCVGCSSASSPHSPDSAAGIPSADDAAPTTVAPRIFRDASGETGLDFVHDDGASGRYFLPEIMGAGAALFDYDDDGDLDVYLVQGAPLAETVDETRENQTPAQASADRPAGSRLFENELSETNALGFRDVTDTAGVGHRGYGMGTAVGDYDNDGDQDLYVTSVGANVLYRNNGDRTFTDVTAEAQVDDPRWSTSASFLDYDNDGDLDLFVANYVDFAPGNHRDCYHTDGSQMHCAPSVHRPVPDSLFENNGDGSFRDVSAESGILSTFGRGLGVSAADLDADGWTDIYVANDGDANQLWRNNANGTFTDIGAISGTAYNTDGQTEAGMGIATADFDHDGDLDLFVSHLTRESNTLYRNEQTGLFRDVTTRFDLATGSLPFTGFGCAWFDYDHDGWLDLFIANGAVEPLPGVPNRFGQRNQLYRGVGGGALEEVPLAPESPLALLETSRGAAFGDVDNDGDLDVVVTNNNGPVRLYLNEVGSARPALLVRLVGTHGDRDSFGARVGVVVAGRTPVWRRVQVDGSYLSSSDRRVHFGLGDADVDQVERIVVAWPGGHSEAFAPAPARELVLREGAGQPWSQPD